MIWINLVIELFLLGFILGAWVREKRKNVKNLLADKQQESLWFRILLPAGRLMERWWPASKQKKERSSMYQVIDQLSEGTEGDQAYEVYRWKRWALVIGLLAVCNSLWTGRQLVQGTEAKVFNPIQVRPDYGEGDQREEVTLVLEGNSDTGRNTFSLQIPQKKLTEEAAADKLQEGMEYIEKLLENQEVYEDISLPSGWEDVSYFYESLTPELLKDDGRWAGEIKTDRQEIRMRITGSLAGQRQSRDICMWVPSQAELPVEKRIQMIQKQVQEGNFITENTLQLPTETALGEQLKWFQADDAGGGKWLVLMAIMAMIILWEQDQEYRQRMKERQQEIQREYPEFINELVILIGAGLSLQAAWKRIGEDYQKQRENGGRRNPLYEEIYRESREMTGGVSMREILEQFTTRIRMKEARRFAVLMSQNLKRGDAFLVTRLKELNQEAWEVRKKQVREKSEEVDTKLLIPLMLMLVVILIIVLAPAMISMQG